MGRRHGETVCVAGVDDYGNWHRLYPVPFRELNNDQRFARWDRIRFRWSRHRDDKRIESKRIDSQSLIRTGKVPERERAGLVDRAMASDLDIELEQGRSLAFIRPEKPRFYWRRLNAAELEKSRRRREHIHNQPGLFSKTIVSREVPPYQFKYKFDHAGRRRDHICIDWETEQTFLKWRRLLGEARALEDMRQKFGADYPSKGMAFAMGTHRVTMFKSWLLSGVLTAPPVTQDSLDL